MANAKAEKYRERAAKMLAEAGTTKDAEAKKTLLGIARQFERLAEWAERKDN